VDTVQKPAVQVNPPALPVPLQGVPIVGVTQVAPLQYSDPDMLPAPLQAPPNTVPPPPEDTDQKPAAQVNPPALADPVHGVPIIGVTQVAPLQ
jgi:hypothetical protein